MTIPRAPFGATGHESSRVLFGAAALGSMRQEKADCLLEMLLEAGVNHIDVAASFGPARAWPPRVFLFDITSNIGHSGKDGA